MPATFLTLLLAILTSCALYAHIGSPNVFFEGSAGPYQLRVSIQPPEVVPGRAQINVRIHNGPISRVTALPVRWDAGRKGAPPPDELVSVLGETNLYITELWLMDFGAYSVFVDVSGPQGQGTAIVPLNSVAQQRLEMSRGASIAFGLAGFILATLLIFIIGSAMRESVLPPNTEIGPIQRSRSRIGMVVAVFLLSLVLWKGNAWWKHVDMEFRNNRLFKPIEVQTSLTPSNDGQVLRLESNADSRELRDHTPLVADHGKLMHLFLIREDMNGFAHLHPLRSGGELSFEAKLPVLPPGTYSVYGEVTHESGLARTLVSTIAIDQPAESAVTDPDDSWWPHSDAAGPLTFRRLDERPVTAGEEVTLRFDVLAGDGKPAPLEPYMGMWSHAVVRSANGSVFTHLHPSGTISMTAQELFARRERGENLRKPIDVLCGRPERELVFPYMFPKPGKYRMWVQVKVTGEIVTKSFDFDVLPGKAS